MSKRYAVLGLSVFLALALAVPALGGPSNPVASISASAKATANKALKKAKAAQSTANTALNTANAVGAELKKVQGEAKNAQTTANAAKTAATNAQNTANEAKTAAAAANTNANSRIKNIEIVFGTSSASNTESPKTVGASCGEPGVVTGGGYAIAGESEKVVVTSSLPQFFYGEGWFVTAKATSGTPTWSIQANAECGRR